MVGSWGCITTSPGSAAAFIRDQRKKRTTAAVVAASYLICSKLPDDIITEILSRLSAHQIMELRSVCKHWLALTSSQSFCELHFKNQPPMDLFLAQYTSYATDLSVSPLLTNSFEFLAISGKPNEWEHRFKRSRIGITAYTSSTDPLQLCKPLLISSYRGFLVFRHCLNEELVLSFYNPMTREQVTVAAPASRYIYCGLYFHSPTKEFRVLYQVHIDHDEQDAGLHGFAILGLRTKTLRRIKNFSHCPSSSAPPIILNGALYWIVSETHVHGHPRGCSETILSFGIENEEFHVMPHPGDKCVFSSGGGGGEEGHDDSHDTYYMNLMDMDGQLCLRVVSDPYRLLETWILEDYKEWIWVKMDVKFELLKELFYDFDVGLPRTMNVLCMHNGELMFDYVKMKYFKCRHYCYRYNFKNEYFRRLNTTCLERGKKFGNVMAVHPSLLSLHNENFGYVLYLHEDQSVEERGDLDKVCQVVETYRKQNSLRSIIKQKFLKWKKL